MMLILKRLFKVLGIVIVIILVLSILGGDTQKETTQNNNTKSENKKNEGVISDKVATDISENTNSDQNQNVSSEEKVKKKGRRVLSTHVIEQAGSAKGIASYDALFQSGLDAGIESVNMSVNWNDAEGPGGVFRPDLFTAANAYYARRNVLMDLDLRPVDTAGIMLPEDLKGKALNDPEVISRFKLFLDNVFAALPSVEFNFLAIGNEVDSVFLNDPKRYGEYKGFLEEIVPYAKAKRSGLKVGMIVTYAGLTGGDAKEYQRLNELNDIILLTYYPIKSDFTTKSLPVFEKEISKVFLLYPNKQIYFSEIGYPSSNESGGSEAKQAEFVHEVFQVWDANSDRIGGVAFFTLNELTPASVNDLTKYFSVASKEFIATLGSMGLIDAGGRKKEGFNVLKEEAEKRGW